MENDLEKALWKDYKEIGDLVKLLTEDDERKKFLLEERDKVRNELLKFELSKNEEKTKQHEMIAENKRESTRNKINIAMFSVSTALSLYAIVRTFRFDQESTVTSTLGRNILSGVIPKMFKR